MSRGLIFRRGDQRFAVALEHVRRVCALRDIQPLPVPATDVLGVVPDGSHIVPVIATPLPPLRQDTGRPRVLLLENGESPFGLQVESLEGPLELMPMTTEALRQAREVPEEAVAGLVTVVDSSGVAPSAAGPLFLLTPGPLYRARSVPEE